MSALVVRSAALARVGGGASGLSHHHAIIRNRYRGLSCSAGQRMSTQQSLGLQLAHPEQLLLLPRQAGAHASRGPSIPAQLVGGLGLGVAVVAAMAWQRADCAHAEKAQAATNISTTTTTTRTPVRALPSRDEIAAVRAAINEVLDEDGDMAAALVGLAWAVSGTFDRAERIGGSGDVAALTRCAGDPDLASALDALRRVAELFPDWSAADIWTFAGAVAVEHMGGPPVHWRAGRRVVALGEGDADPSAVTATTGGGGGLLLFSSALPKGSAHPSGIGDTVRHVRSVFARQGFSDRELVALMGAHAICRCYPSSPAAADVAYSGVVLTRAPAAFGNEYFRSLLGNTWTLRKGEELDQFENGPGDLIILPADMALLWDKDLRKHVELFAKDEDAFFGAFASAFQKLEENGVDTFMHRAEERPWYKFW